MSGIIFGRMDVQHDDPDWQIIQSPFMQDNVRTLEFRDQITVASDKLVCRETTIVDIYGRLFEYTDDMGHRGLTPFSDLPGGRRGKGKQSVQSVFPS